MTDAEKIKRIKTILGNASLSDDKVAVYLDLAKSEIVNRLYSLFDEIPTTSIPPRYENKQIMLAIAMMNSADNGIFGLSQHTESAGGTSVTDVYGSRSSEWSMYLSDIIPVARISKG